MIKVIIEIGTFLFESSFLFESTSTETFGEANLEFGLQSDGSLVQIHTFKLGSREKNWTSLYLWFKLNKPEYRDQKDRAGTGLGWVWDHGGPDNEVPLEFECWGDRASPSGTLLAADEANV